MTEPKKPRLEVAPVDEPRRIDTTLLRPRDVEIVVRDYEDGEPIEQIYTIRGNLPTETVIELFELEQRIKAIDAGDRQALIEACEEVNALITELVQERYPDAALKFGVEEALGILAFIAQNHTVEHEIANAITGSDTRPNRAERRARPPRKTAAARRR